MSAIQQVRTRLEGMPPGEPFPTSAFLDLGARATIDQALARLVKAGVIERLARGVFARPKENRFVGKMLPSPLSVAQAIARNSGAVVGVHGAEALRRFGLSTQVPAQPVFYTTGPSRRFELGQMEVTLKHVAPRKLALAGRPAGLALSALWYLGKGGVTPEVIETIARKLEPEELRKLREAKAVMPAWMSDAFHRYDERRAHG
jgi:hypothetical protein